MNDKKLKDLGQNGKIFCIAFNGQRILDADYVVISFHGNYDANGKNWTNYSTRHETKPMGSSSCVETDCLDKHCFLQEGCSAMGFCTLNLETWKTDLKLEMQRLIEIKKKIFSDELVNFENKILNLLNNNEINI